MLTLPPILPAFAAPDEVAELVEAPEPELFDAPPQAVATRATATNDMRHVTRFIDTLRSPPTIASVPRGHAVCSERASR
jgi:hypothetical protein